MKRNHIKAGCGIVFIRLVGTLNALVDIDDLPKIQGHFWAITPNRGGKTDYVCTCVGSGPAKHRVMLHHLIVGKPPKGMVVDHINRNGFDNRRCNLRIVPMGLNSYNRAAQLNCPNGYRGVYQHTKMKKGLGEYWEARIGFDGRSIYIGLFRSAEDAARAYDVKALELYGGDAEMNFPRLLPVTHL